MPNVPTDTYWAWGVNEQLATLPRLGITTTPSDSHSNGARTSASTSSSGQRPGSTRSDRTTQQPAKDPAVRVHELIDILTDHVADARRAGLSERDARRSALVLACMSPGISGVGF